MIKFLQKFFKEPAIVSKSTTSNEHNTQSNLLLTNKANAMKSYLNNMQDARPTWLSLSDKTACINAYLSCPPLFSVINYSANCFSRAEFKHYKIQGNGKKVEVKNSQLIHKLYNPNPLQSKIEFLQQNYIYLQAAGNSQIYVVSLMPDNYEQILNLWNLPTYLITYETTGKLFAAQNLNEIITKIKFDGQIRTDISIENLILQNDINVKYENGQYFIGESRIKSLNKPISNIIEILTSQNVLISKRGALGILSNEGTDGIGSPMSVDSREKEIIQNNFSRYGLQSDQWQIIITDANLRWQQMAMPVADMMFEEMYIRSKTEICDAYNFPIPLLNEFESAAGQANMQQFESQLYQNKIIPDWKKLEDNLNGFFKLSDKKEIIEITFNHIESLQKNKKLYAEVGSINTKIILDVQASFKNGITSEQSAINIITETITEDKDKAKELLSLEKKEIETNELIEDTQNDNTENK